MRGARLAILFSIVAFWLAPRSAAEAPALAGYRVIVHPQNAEETLDRAFLANVFLKKVTRWRNGEVVRPVDLPIASPVRRKFSEEVLGRSVSAVRSYWQQLIFSGRDVPPPELDSDAAVIAYVLRTPGAVGYVSGAATLGSAKPVALR